MALLLIVVDSAAVSPAKTVTLVGGWGKALLVAFLTFWSFDVSATGRNVEGCSGKGSWLAASD